RSKACGNNHWNPSGGFREDQFNAPVRLRVENADIKMRVATEFLSAWHTLLVLDNMETIQDGRILEFVQKLPPSNRCKVLLTSRMRTGGWELPISVQEFSLMELREFALAKALEMGVTISDSMEFMEQLRTATGGLPLAVQWVLGQLKLGIPANQILANVRSDGSPVLEFSFRNIWQRISSDARSVMVAQTVFEQPPTLQGLCIASHWDTERIVRALDELSDVTLVSGVRRQVDGKTVYVALPITQSFARNEASEFGVFERECQQRVNAYDQQMKLQDAEVRRFASTFERFGITSDSGKRAAILCSRGQAELFSGNTMMAEDLFKEARETAPDSAYVLAMCASYELARNRTGVASEYAERACERCTKLTGHLCYTVLARAYDVVRNRQKVVDCLAKALTYEPENVVTRHKYGVALSRNGKPADAIAEFTQIIDVEVIREPPRGTLLMALKTRALNFGRLGRAQEAAIDLAKGRQIIAKYPYLSEHATDFDEE
ncbi:MAG: hypothetical protein SH850_14185, partial [Planctomycetaceae bacterium]|nr:hypothetical protein [Planctomycetaceae bacterium]